jgi:LPXTG-motif cell wall-anchored protein
MTTVPGSGSNAITVTAGGSLTITDQGWAAHSKVDIALHSDPVSLGSAQADGKGAIKTTVVIPADTDPGRHEVVLTGTAPNGDPQTHTLDVIVEASTVTNEGATASGSPTESSTAETNGALPRTGAPDSALLIMGVAVLGTGIALVARRRRTS